MTYSFVKQNKIGKIGENKINQFYKDKFKKLDGIHADFEILETPDLFELKTDTWSLLDSPNFFIEKYSDFLKKSPGGPYQALHQHGCKYFCYLYIENNTCFWFNTQKLITKADELIETLSLPAKLIKNRNYETGGFLIKRDWVKDIYKEVSLDSDTPNLEFLPSL